MSTAAGVLEQLPAWFRDYDEHHPHQGLEARDALSAEIPLRQL